jgi:hypothetical protein
MCIYNDVAFVVARWNMFNDQQHWLLVVFATMNSFLLFNLAKEWCIWSKEKNCCISKFQWHCGTKCALKHINTIENMGHVYKGLWWALMMLNVIAFILLGFYQASKVASFTRFKKPSLVLSLVIIIIIIIMTFHLCRMGVHA